MLTYSSLSTSPCISVLVNNHHRAAESIFVFPKSRVSLPPPPPAVNMLPAAEILWPTVSLNFSLFACSIEVTSTLHAVCPTAHQKKYLPWQQSKSTHTLFSLNSSPFQKPEQQRETTVSLNRFSSANSGTCASVWVGGFSRSVNCLNFLSMRSYSRSRVSNLSFDPRRLRRFINLPSEGQ